MTEKITDRATLEAMAAQLEASEDYRVLRRFVPRPAYEQPSPAKVHRGLIVDVESTGLDTANDAIIELGLVAFEFDTHGRVYAVDEARSWFEDPGRPIPPECVELTGITDDMVRGQRIDDAAVEREIARAVLVIAHNAGFDRRMLERRFPGFADKYWGCSMQEVPWPRFGCRGSKLEYLLFRACGEFHTGHRAGDDCLATLHVLAVPRDGDVSPLQLLLEQARRVTHRLWAIGTPIELKDVLKSRGYRWYPGGSRTPKSWYRDCSAQELEVEQTWLREHAYDGRPNPPWRVDRYTGKERYSERMGA
ncbi:MAG: 3'-5' exonuclease [Gemmatimonadaceae bacterium]|nr:3'-5' exonuclease [Gemmatimonadaceae bacterium]